MHAVAARHASIRRDDPGDPHANPPWYVVPTDHKSFTRLVVAAALVEALEQLDLKAFPRSAERNSKK
jgi:polyphosphate kinase 2 (PPK2 family)